MLDTDLQEIRSELWPLIKTGHCFVWIGSGLSKAIGYPEWEAAIQEICNTCNIAYFEKDETITADKLLDKAEECKIADIVRYKQTLGRLYGASKPTTRKAFTLLMKLPFRGYITTNFDSLLSEAAASALQRTRILQAYPIIYAGNIDSTVNVFYIHGIATAAGDNLILARSDFDSAYRTGLGPVHALLFTVLMFKPILFVGCSLKEPVMKEVFRRVRDIQEEIKINYPTLTFPQRLALLPFRYEASIALNDNEMPKRDEEEEKAEYERFSEMDIRIVRYDPYNPPMHMKIEEILEQLCKDEDIEVRLKQKVDFGEALPS